MKLTFLTWLLCIYVYCLLDITAISNANPMNHFNRLRKLRKSVNPPNDDAWPDLETNSEYTPVYIGPQDGLMESDKMGALPGQPEGVDFDQYSGYVTVDPKAGRALFYYFVESPENSSTNPLVLWLNGGPGSSSVGYGAMEELGPFRVNSDAKTLYKNPYAWNSVANVIFLDTPAGVGYSYSNMSSDYAKSGDKNTADDNYRFLINWLERFPQYKTRDFFITGESYAGHYIPQLAYTILLNNRNTNHTVINLKGIAMGNAELDDYTDEFGQYDYYWSHALNSDETNMAIHKLCKKNLTSDPCEDAKEQGDEGDLGRIDIYNVYAPTCPLGEINNHTKDSVHNFNPCTDGFVLDYLDLPEVQKAFHANLTIPYSLTSWLITWNDRPATVLPTIKQLMATNISIWLYSGDMDGRVPVTSTRYAINTFKLPIKSSWRPWYTNKEVGGYVVEYEGLTFVTVRGAGHLVPSYQPERALTMISSFLQGKLPLLDLGTKNTSNPA